MIHKREILVCDVGSATKHTDSRYTAECQSFGTVLLKMLQYHRNRLPSVAFRALSDHM
jgi:hypothetical protein